MNYEVPPIPEPDPKPLGLESLEEKLRTMPQPPVPEDLPAKLATGIPAAVAAGTIASNLVKPWVWLAGVGAAAVVVAVVSIVASSKWQSAAPPAKPPVPPGNIHAPDSNAPGRSQAISDYERAVNVDPYNAEAWFNLAKAQAELHRVDDAISSAQKAIDIAKSRGRTEFVQTVEAWLKSFRGANAPAR